MSIEADLRTLLLTFDAVTALTGTGSSARIRPYHIHTDDDITAEHITIDVDTIRHLNDIDGTSQRIYADVTLRCCAATRTKANALAEAVRVNGTDPGTGLAGYTGTVNGHVFDAVLEDETTAWEPYSDGSDRGHHVVYQTYTVTMAETA